MCEASYRMDKWLAPNAVWREPKDHSSDCYISLTNITEITSKSKHTVKYPDFPSAVRFVPDSLRKI
jgi:hypothetical protein